MDISNNTLHIGLSSGFNQIMEVAAMLPRFYDYEIREDVPFLYVTRNDNGKEVYVPCNWGHNLWEIFVWADERPSNFDLVVMLVDKLERHFDENEVTHRLVELAQEVTEAFDKAWYWWSENDKSITSLDRIAWAARRLMIRKIEKENWIENLVHEHSYKLQFVEAEIISA